MILESTDESSNRQLQKKQLIDNEESFESGEHLHQLTAKVNKKTQIRANDGELGTIKDEVFYIKNISLLTQLQRKISRNCLIVTLILFFAIIILVVLCFIFL